MTNFCMPDPLTYLVVFVEAYLIYFLYLVISVFNQISRLTTWKQSEIRCLQKKLPTTANKFLNCENFYSKEEGKVQESIQSITTPDPRHHGKVTKTQGNITHKRAKRSALSQQMITRLQGTDKTV